MYWLTDFLTPPLAIISALVGLLLAVDQLTAAARLKRESSFWREEMQASDLRQDREVMESLHRTATARLIAIKVVPARRLLVPAYFFIAGIALAFSFAHVIGGIAPQPITLASISAEGLDIISGIFIPLLVFMGMIGIASVFIRRRHLMRSYLDGEIIADRPPRFTEDGGVWLGFHLGKWKWITFGTFAFGLCSFTAAAGFTLGAGVDNIQSWTALWLVGSFMLLFFSFGPIPALYRMGRETPIHPRRLTDEASVPRGATKEGSRDVRQQSSRMIRGTHTLKRVSANRRRR